MGYSNVAGALNVFTSTSTDSLVVRGDMAIVGNIFAPAGSHNFGSLTAANLTVTGNFTITATNTQVTNALSINNAGTATALKVTQYEGGGPGHIYNVAEFWDFQTLAMVIDPRGNVGIHTDASPGYALTVSQGAFIDTVTSQLFTGDGAGLSNVSTSSLVGALAPFQLQAAQTNVTQVGTLTGLYSSGNVTASFFAGQGNALSNIQSASLVGNVARANVALVVSQPSQPNITQVGTLTGLFSSGNVTASFFSGQGNALSNIQSAVLVGNVASANTALVVTQPFQPNITQVGTLTGLFVNGNVTASFFSGQGNALSNIQSAVLVGNVANANVALVVSQPVQSNITQVGTLTGLTVNGLLTASNGSGISNLTAAAITGNVARANVALVVSQPLQPNITQVGTLTGLYSTGNVTASFFSGQGNALTNVLSSVLVGNVASANTALVVSQPVQSNITQVGTLTGLTVSGVLQAALFTGNASGLSNINSSNLVGNVASANTALVVTQPFQPNIAQVGTLTGLFVNGNVTASFFSGQGNALTNVLSSVLVGNVARANVALVVSQPLQPNITQVGTLTGLYSTGNVTASFFSGQGNALTNVLSSVLVGNVANANVALVVSQPVQSNITQVGTLTGLTVSGVLQAALFTGNASGLSNINSSNLVGNVASSNTALVVTQPVQPNITQVGTLTGLYSTGNVTASFFSGQGNALTNVLSSVLVGNVARANVALVVSQPVQSNITQVGTLTGLTVSGVLQAALFTGNASGLSNINSSNLVGNVASANTALVVTQPLQPNITQVGTLTGLYSTGNVTASFFSGQGNALSNVQSASLVGNVAQANVALVVSQPLQPNITQVGTLTGLFVSGNVTASFFSGQGNALSNIQSASLVGNVAAANVALVVTQPLQPNITQVGTLTGLFVNGNVTASFFSGQGNALSNIQSASLVGNVAAANVALVVSQPFQPNITQVGTLTGLFVNGNVTASFFSGQGNALTNVLSSVLVGNVAAANVALVVSQPFQPNITQVGTLTGLFVNGNVTASFFSGQGNALTNVLSSVLVGNVAAANVALVVSQPSQPNITQVGTLTGLFVNGNVTAPFFIGGGNALSNVQSASLVGNVASANVALVVSQPAQPNITSVGTLTSLNVSGNIYAANAITTTNIFTAGFTSNATNTVFNFDTLTMPFVSCTTLNVASTANISSLNAGTLTASDGSGISNITAAAITGNVARANVALVVSQPLQPNITQVGTLTGLFVNGNVTASFFSGQGNALTNIQSSVLVGNVAAANVALVVSQPLQPNITQVGTLTGLFATGNVSAPFFVGGANAMSNLNASNVTFGALAAARLQAAQTNVTSVGTLTSLTVSGNSNLQTLNVASISTPGVIPVSSGLFMNLNATYTLNATGNWTGNVAGSVTSNLFTLFGPNPVASWTVYGSNPLITGPTANGGFRFGQTGPYQFTIVLCSDNNIKTIALSSNTSDVHSNLADPGVWLYCYRISVGQDPSVPVQIPFYVDSTSKYYFIDFEAMQNTTENIHKTAYTNVTAEGYTGSYVTLRPL
jgi:hypothetical protein